MRESAAEVLAAARAEHGIDEKEANRRKLAEVGREAITSARRLLPGKSYNKTYEDEDSIEYTDDEEDESGDDLYLPPPLRNLRREVDAVTAAWEDDDKTELQSLVNKIYDIISKKKYAGGNCAEYSQLAAYHLFQARTNGILEKNTLIDILKLTGDKGDHMFTAVNQPKNSDGSYPKDFSDWNEDAIIVDAWANISCPAREYPQEWAKQMQKWSALGKLVNGESALNQIALLTDCGKASRYC
ncbi:MAG: hypothetical protein C5B47_01555 [Verrucomicrobia bacterium]|nr:MAG: hypothetical protein C5B47_01555 [Verrucomicrobiota bacterium]